MKTLLGLITASASLLRILAAPQADLADNHHLKKRQTGTYNVTDGNDSNGPKGYVIASETPLVCLQGCLDPLGFVNGCFGQGMQEGCQGLCMQGNYTQLVACLNCVIVNGEQDVTVSEVNDKLGLVNSQCSGTSGFTGVSSLTATAATVTGPFTTSFTADTIRLPTWTGLASYVATMTYDPIDSILASRASADAGVGATDGGPASVSGTGTVSSVPANPSGSSPPTSGTSGLQGSSVPTSSASATASPAGGPTSSSNKPSGAARERVSVSRSTALAIVMSTLAVVLGLNLV